MAPGAIGIADAQADVRSGGVETGGMHTEGYGAFSHSAVIGQDDSVAGPDAVDGNA